MLDAVQLVGTSISKRCCRRWVQQVVGKVTGGLHGGIAGGRFWHNTLVQEELDGLGCVFGAGIWNLVLVASVMFRSGTDVPAVYTMRCPGAVIGWGFKHEDSCYFGGKGRSIKVENAVELCFF